MFYPTSMPLLVGIALFGAAGANALITNLTHSLAGDADRGPRSAGRFGKADWLVITVLTILLASSVFVVVGRAIGHIDGSAMPRSGSVTAPVVDRSR